MLAGKIRHAVQAMQTDGLYQAGVTNYKCPRAATWHLVMTREDDGAIRSALTFADEHITHTFQPRNVETFMEAIVPILQTLTTADDTIHVLGRATPRSKWQVIPPPTMGGRRHLSEKAKKRLLRF